MGPTERAENTGPLAELGRRLRRLSKHRTYNEYIWAYIFVAPAMLAFVLFLAYPAVQSLLFSFQKFTAFETEHAFVGFRNYVTLFRDPVWWIAVRNTVVYTLATVPFSIIVSLLIALALMKLSSPLQTLFKTMFYMPGVTSAVVIGLVWLWIYYPFSGGLANYIVTSLGMPKQNWLGSPNTALFSIIFMNWMMGHGASIVLYMAALGGVPRSLYEASEVDCASTWTTFWHITWPLIKPTTLYAAITSTAGSFLIFDTVYTMTRGGPGYSTVTMVYKTYITAFQQFNFGLSSAMAMFLAVLVVGFSILQFKFLTTDVEY